MADSHEQPRNFEGFNVIRILGIAQTQAAYAHLVAGHFFQRTVGVQHNIAALHFVHQAFDKDFFRAEAVTTVDQMHFRSNVRQVQRLFDGRIAAADDGNLLVTIEETVAGRAGRHAAALKRFFRGKTQIAC